MKKFVTKVQELGNKAAQIKAAIESVPPRVQEVREAVAATAGQLQQLRAEVQSNVTSLRTETEDDLIETLREIDGAAATFREAGYQLYDTEMELGPSQRLLVHLEKLEDVSHPKLRSLIAAHQGFQTTHAILSALLKAEELAERVDLTNVTYHKLTVFVGKMPMVRLCWCANDVEAHMAIAPTSAPAHVATPSSSAPSSPALASSMFGSGSFFEKQAPTVPTHALENAPTPAAPHAPSASASIPAASTPETDPLARFKKMPNLSKYRS
jgi:hypothetical protein